MKIGQFDAVTGEQIERDATPEEVAEREAEVARFAQEKAERLTKEAELRANKISAYQKMGLTADEIEALLPTPKPNLKNLGGN